MPRCHFGRPSRAPSGMTSSSVPVTPRMTDTRPRSTACGPSGRAGSRNVTLASGQRLFGGDQAEQLGRVGRLQVARGDAEFERVEVDRGEEPAAPGRRSCPGPSGRRRSSRPDPSGCRGRGRCHRPRPCSWPRTRRGRRPWGTGSRVRRWPTVRSSTDASRAKSNGHSRPARSAAGTGPDRATSVTPCWRSASYRKCTHAPYSRLSATSTTFRPPGGSRADPLAHSLNAPMPGPHQTW